MRIEPRYVSSFRRKRLKPKFIKQTLKVASKFKNAIAGFFIFQGLIKCPGEMKCLDREDLVSMISQFQDPVFSSTWKYDLATFYYCLYPSIRFSSKRLLQKSLLKILLKHLNTLEVSALNDVAT